MPGACSTQSPPRTDKPTGCGPVGLSYRIVALQALLLDRRLRRPPSRFDIQHEDGRLARGPPRRGAAEDDVVAAFRKDYRA